MAFITAYQVSKGSPEAFSAEVEKISHSSIDKVFGTSYGADFVKAAAEIIDFRISWFDEYSPIETAFESETAFYKSFLRRCLENQERIATWIAAARSAYDEALIKSAIAGVQVTEGDEEGKGTSESSVTVDKDVKSDSSGKTSAESKSADLPATAATSALVADYADSATANDSSFSTGGTVATDETRKSSGGDTQSKSWSETKKDPTQILEKASGLSALPSLPMTEVWRLFAPLFKESEIDLESYL